MSVYCLACGGENPADAVQCQRCLHPLLVLHAAAGEGGEEFRVVDEVPVALEEHLLERVSLLEEALKRTAEAVRRIAAAVSRLEQGQEVEAASREAVRALLVDKGVARPEDWVAACAKSGERQRAAAEKRDRFGEARERLLAAAPGAQRRRYARLLAEAEEAYDELDAERGAAALARALALAPGNSELALFLGEVAFDDGDDRRALELFESVLEARPGDFEALLYSGVILHERGELRRAVGRLRRAVDRRPDRFLPRFALGAVLASQGKLEPAILHLERAVTLRPAPQAHFLLGTCLYESGRARLAIRHLREAVKGDPSLEEAHYVLGLACLDRGWPTRARAAFRAAQRLNPGLAVPLSEKPGRRAASAVGAAASARRRVAGARFLEALRGAARQVEAVEEERAAE